MIGDATGGTGFGSDITGVAAATVINTTLADNGGPTQTHALVAGSPAFDAGNNADVPGGITTDQRGTGFDRIFNGTVDIGAYELQAIAPVLDLNGAASGIDYSETFIRGGGEVSIVDSANLSVTDDGANLENATVTITNLQDGANELLTVDTSGTSISFNYNSGTGVLTLSGSDTVANYQQVLRTVKYNNTFVLPNTTARAIEFLVNDGSLNSTTATTTLNITSMPIDVGTVSGPTFPSMANLDDSNPDNIYTLTLDAASQFLVEVVVRDGNADLELYNSSGVLLASSTNSGMTTERIYLPSIGAGDYIVRVFQASAGETLRYWPRMIALPL